MTKGSLLNSDGVAFLVGNAYRERRKRVFLDYVALQEDLQLGKSREKKVIAALNI